MLRNKVLRKKIKSYHTKINALLKEIKTAISTYAKSKKYDAVVEKKTIYYGNDKVKDISNEVLKTIKK